MASATVFDRLTTPRWMPIALPWGFVIAGLCIPRLVH
jgi:hypothetical protein